MTLGTRIAVMNRGRLVQVGSPLEVYERPANPFVARFVGAPAMNLWRETTGGEAVMVGVRPHDIEMVAPGAGELDGTVEVVETLGAQTVVHLATGPGRDLIRVAVPASRRVRPGDRVGVAWSADRVHRFDQGSGRRKA